MKKKTKIMILSVVALILVTIGITYAYWLVTKSQEGENVITTGCLDITLDGENDITLSDQFPLSDEDGMKLTPYTFTVTNNCTTSVDYQINLEALGTEADALKTSSLKVVLDDNSSRLLSSYREVETTIEGSYESHQLATGTLGAATIANTNNKVTYKLRLWIDENAPISEMDKTFRSKISVTIGQGIVNPYKEGTLAYDILSNYGGKNSIVEYKDGLSETGIYKTIDDLGDTYYFRGEPNDNYIIFGDRTAWLEFEAYYFTVHTCYSYYYYDETTGEEIFSDEFYSLKDCETEAQNNGYPEGICYNNDMITDESDYYFTKDECEMARMLKSSELEEPTDYIMACEARFDGDEINSPMMWRIIRINGDGTIRLVYAGQYLHGKINQAYATYDEANLYHYEDGLTLIGLNDSDIYQDFLDGWYNDNLKTNYEKYIADGIFCQEKTDYKEYKYTVGTTEYIDKLYGENTPGFTCLSKNDRYTVNDTLNGNGLLSSPIGLPTIDEVNYSGEFLKSSGEMTMSFSKYNAQQGIYDMYNFDGSESESSWGIVLPVINLKADVLFEGEGTVASPYQIVMN